MDASLESYPSDHALSFFALGKLDDRSSRAVETHLKQCEGCRRRVAEISADSFVRRLRGANEPGASGGSSQHGPAAVDAGAAAVPPPAALTLPPGFADHPDYEIKRELGRGGMGVVYLAYNRLMGRNEVLKVMSRQITERPGVLDRFLREIRAVAKLRHRNIVTAYSAARFGESIVFAMEYVDGQDLALLVKSDGRLPVAQACYFAYQAALGLQHAHERGLVHRDIKPGNLMLSRDGNKAVVRVLDFGLSKAVSDGKVDAELTSEGQTLGTPDFIAPEQIIDAQSADIRSDIYSLGGTLYFLLAGRPPFRRRSLFDLYQAHISVEADPLNLIRPEVPVELAAFVGKMMAKDPARRPQTPKEAALGLITFFKSAGAGPKSATADIFPDDHPVAAPPSDEAVGPAPSAEIPRDASLEAARWETVIRIDENELAAAAAVNLQPDRRSRRARWPKAVSMLPLGLIAVGVAIIAMALQNVNKLKSQPPAIAKVENQRSSKASGLASALPIPPARPQLQATKMGGDWTVEDSALVQSATLGPALVAFGDPSWSRYDFGFEVLVMEGRQGCWTMFHFKDWQNHLNFYLGGPGYRFHGVGTVFEGTLAHEKIAGTVNHQQWYKVLVIVRGSHYRCFLDGEQLIEGTDGRFTEGRIGLGSYDTAVRFRNIEVKDPGGGIMFRGIPELVDE
jgi:serine/threonine protein kinase